MKCALLYGRTVWHMNGIYIIDHLHRVLDGSHTKWKYPKREDVQMVEPEQIVKCDIKGEWNYSPDSRKRLFTITNVKTIVEHFRNLLSKCCALMKFCCL